LNGKVIVETHYLLLLKFSGGFMGGAKGALAPPMRPKLMLEFFFPKINFN